MKPLRAFCTSCAGRPGHWASWAAEVASVDFDSATGVANFTVSKGFFQGSRGADTGDEVYMENVFEVGRPAAGQTCAADSYRTVCRNRQACTLCVAASSYDAEQELDYPAEWYFDEVTQTLYLWHNASAGTPPPVDGSVVITQVKNLFNITGTQEAPVTDVSFVGIGFRDTAYTYMDPHSESRAGRCRSCHGSTRASLWALCRYWCPPHPLPCRHPLGWRLDAGARRCPRV